jgi:hypothetical protein
LYPLLSFLQVEIIFLALLSDFGFDFNVDFISVKLTDSLTQILSLESR